MNILIFIFNIICGIIIVFLYFYNLIVYGTAVEYSTHTAVLEYVEFNPKTELIKSVLGLTTYVFLSLYIVYLQKKEILRRIIIGVLFLLQTPLLFYNLVGQFIKSDIAFDEVILMVNVSTLLNLLLTAFFLGLLIRIALRSKKV